MTDGRKPKDVCRTVLYLIDRVLEREETQLNGVVVFHDLNGLQRQNVHPEIPKLIMQGIIGHFPLKIVGMYLLNAPWFFQVLFNVIKLFLPKKLKERIYFIDSLEEVYKVVDKEKLLVEHGGELDFDPDTWVDHHRDRELNGDFNTLLSCAKM